LFYAVLTCLAVWLLVLIPGEVGKPVTLFGAAPEGLSPDAMPRIVLIGLAGLSGFGLWGAFRKQSPRLTAPSLRVAITCGASFVFAAALVPLGFVLASALTVGLLALYLGGRHPVGLALSAGVVPCLLYFVFTRVLHISLPASPLGI